MGKVYELGERVVIARDLNCRLKYFKLPPGKVYRKEIKKPDGRVRLIFVPDKKQRKILRKIARLLTSNYHWFIVNRYDWRDTTVQPWPVFGFRRGGNVVDAVLPHCGKRFTLSVDIVDFFHNCYLLDAESAYMRNVGRHRNLKRKCNFSALAFDFVRDQFVWPFDAQAKPVGRLPQGFPTSPILSNFAFYQYDIDILEWCGHNDVIYTRYADDLCFSFDKPEMVDRVLHLLKRLPPHFELCKIKLQDAAQGRKRLLGLMVDKNGCYLPRKKRRLLRLLLKINPDSAQTKGLLAWKKFIDRKMNEWVVEAHKLLGGL